MPVQYEKSGGQGHKYQVPDYPEAADGPRAFKDFADFLDLILPPVGTIMPFVGNSSPSGWLPCNGGEYSSTTYPKLSALCGTKFGTASAGNFRVPDLRGRSIAGLDSSQSEFDTVGKTGGVKSVTLTVSNMPSHNHTATLSGLTLSASASSAGDHGHTASTSISTGGGHNHDTMLNTTSTYDRTGGGNGSAWVNTANGNLTNSAGSHSHIATTTLLNAGAHTHTISGTISGGSVTVNNTGSGTALNILNPYVTLNHIIRAA